MLSIIIVGHNNKDLITDCIKSIQEDASLKNKEIIVVDNGSTDGSQSAIKKLQKSIPNVTLIENKENLGFAKANNQGIKKARGEYVLLLNSDIIVKKGSLGKLLAFAKKKKDAGVVGPKLLNIDGSLQPSCFRFPTIGNAIREYWLGEKGLFEKYAPKGKKASTVDALVGAAFLMTPAVLEKVGVLDEKYFAYFEDIDYCRNAWKKGLKVYYYPGAEIIHYHGATFKKMAFKKMVKKEDQWRKLIPSSKIYHGVLKHYILFIIMWLGQKWQRLFKK